MSFLAVFVGALVSAWSGIAASQTRGFTVEDVIEKAAPAVVRIVAYDITGAKRGEGSGFFIAPGQILTNAHVLEHGYSARVQSLRRAYEYVTITKRDDEVDLAVLAVEGAAEPTIAMAERGDVRPGQRVLAIGNPLGLERSVSDGLVSAVRGIPGVLQLIQITAPISPGSSGGPLLDLGGSAIGVTCASVSEGQNVNFAIGIETVKRFLQKPDSPEPLKKAGTRVLWRAILNRAGRIVVAIVAIAFAGGWWIIGVAFGLIALLIWIVIALSRLVTGPLRRRREARAMITDDSSYGETFGGIHGGPASAPVETDESLGAGTAEEKMVSFHCWRCGELIHLQNPEPDDAVQCPACGTLLAIPED